MGKTRNYFLIAKDYCSNDFNMIFFDNKNKFNLYELDSYTINYSSKDELIDNLYSKGFIKNKDVDLFVAGLNRDNKLEKYEVIYSENDKTNNSIQNILSLLKNNKQLSSLETDSIIKKFISAFLYDLDYRNIVEFGFTDIDYWFINFFDRTTGKPISKNILEQNNFLFSNYKLLRNIIESFNSYNRLLNQHRLYTTGESNVFEDTIDIFNNIKEKRNEIDDELIKRIKVEESKYKADSQLTIFEQEYELSNIKKNNNDVKLLHGKEYENFDEELNKLILIKDTISILPSKTISNTNGYMFNPNMFVYYSTSFDKKFLTTNFDNKFIELLDLYILTNSKLLNNYLKEDEKVELQIKLNKLDKEICDYLLLNKDTFNNAFNWCKVYNRNREYNLKLRERLKGIYYDREEKLYTYQNN